jgi:hypothetical protein
MRRRPIMKLKPLRLAVLSAVAYVVANPKARAKAGELIGQAREKVDQLRGRPSGTEDGVSPYQQTPEGDVESEDPAGTWADDGGGGVGGGQGADSTTTP